VPAAVGVRAEKLGCTCIRQAQLIDVPQGQRCPGNDTASHAVAFQSSRIQQAPMAPGGQSWHIELCMWSDQSTTARLRHLGLHAVSVADDAMHLSHAQQCAIWKESGSPIIPSIVVATCDFASGTCILLAAAKRTSMCTLQEACCVGAATESDRTGLRKSHTCAGCVLGTIFTHRKF
jgi:hypothetical protein